MNFNIPMSSTPLNPPYHSPSPEENSMEDTLSLAEAMEDLVSAEDFLDYFAVPYEPSVVQVNRLHILQRFHDYL
ncbi:MAG TPA: nitrogenase-stabilizing/protective protein NifW, partial [Azonexus sp.]